MFSPDVRVLGFDVEDWVRLGHVFRGAPRPSAPSKPGGGIVAVTRAGLLQKLLSTRDGRRELAGHPWPLGLPELAARHGAAWAVELTDSALSRVADDFAERLRPSDTYLSQVLLLLGVLREVESDGGLRLWPWPITEWPIPNERAVVRALDALLPVEASALLGVFDADELYTCLLLRRGPRGIDAILGPGELRASSGLLSGDYRRDYRFLSEAAERVAGRVALGCFGELRTYQALFGTPRPGAWAAAVAARDVIVTPVTPGVAVPLGLDVGRALYAGAREVAARFGVSDWLRPAERLRPALARGLPLFEADVTAWLGFDPLLLLARLLRR